MTCLHCAKPTKRLLCPACVAERCCSKNNRCVHRHPDRPNLFAIACIVSATVLASCGTGAPRGSSGVGDAAQPPRSHSFDGGRLLAGAPATTSSTEHVTAPRASRSNTVPRRVGPQPAAAAPPLYAEVDGMPALLRRICGCESNGSPTAPINWTAQNKHSTASGGGQVLDSTWLDAKHGTGWAIAYGSDVGAAQYAKARLAPPDVQRTVLVRAFERQGTGPWAASRGCWG